MVSCALQLSAIIQIAKSKVNCFIRFIAMQIPYQKLGRDYYWHQEYSLSQEERKAIFCIIPKQDPKECCHLRKIYYFCGVVGVIPSPLHIWWKCFRFYPCKKIWQFSTKRGYDSTHFLYSYVAVHNLCIYPYYPSVGSCIVYSFRVLSEPSCR